ncbi:MAG TPA: flagellar hook-basal body complex protein FliE [Rhodanobacteraceae bacterium]|nr:flagellar hook-basal body complex protein FliE [Rhodanobacteraceae bacterium]
MNPIGVTSVLADLRGIRSKLVGMAESSAPSGATTPGGTAATSPDAGSFASLLHQSLADVESSQQQASQLSTEFEQGNPNASLPQVMIAVEKANLTFDGAVQVRNKVVDAYNTVMGMQV